jgi:DNA polymerase III alpha subunit
MIPIFKSCYSIGKSILTIEESDDVDGPDSIINICKENNIDKLVLVEDCMTGFIKSHNLCKENDIQLVFGLRLTCCNNIEEDSNLSNHKIIIFAKNDNGCTILNKISTFTSLVGKNKIDFNYLNSIWTKDLDLVVPFYDSFIFNNSMYLNNCIPDFNKIKPSFLIERNGLPFDSLIEDLVLKFTNYDKIYNTVLCKSIFYKSRKDYEALQTYKILCNRSFGKVSSLSNPNLNHFGSNEFCFESYLENHERELTKI